MKLSHLDQAGRARMVDVGDKPISVRTAVAAGAIRMSSDAFQLVADQNHAAPQHQTLSFRIHTPLL